MSANPGTAPPTTAFDLSASPVGLLRTGGSVLLPGEGPPVRIDGLTVGAPRISSEPPHLGERHPDGDELLYVVSGAADVVLDVDERGQGGRTVSLGPGQAFVVPQGVWHRVLLRELTHLVHVTPGPHGDHHPLLPESGGGGGR